MQTSCNFHESEININFCWFGNGKSINARRQAATIQVNDNDEMMSEERLSDMMAVS